MSLSLGLQMLKVMATIRMLSKKRKLQIFKGLIKERSTHRL